MTDFNFKNNDRLPGKALVVLTALWWTFVFNWPFFSHMFGWNDADFAWTGSLIRALITTVAGFFCLCAALVTLITVLPRIAARVLLLILAVAGAASFVGSMLYGMVLTPDMARNFLATDMHEATAYISLRTCGIFALAALPPAAVALFAPLPAVRRVLTPLKRLAAALLLAVAGVAVLALNLQAIAGPIRAQKKTLRYEIAPVNAVWSVLATTIKDTAPEHNGPRTQVDPAPAVDVTLKRPAVLVVVVGETTRSANWGLAGYERDTTPRLRALLEKGDLLSDPKASACGTSTDVSLPCMMSRIGRADYDRKAILSEEALPTLLARAGVNVRWVDNQSGSKGTTEGVAYRETDKQGPLCRDGVCYDGVFVSELQKDLKDLPADRPTVLFYHEYAQHGPAYTRGSPDSEKVWKPECLDADFSACKRETIINAFDNGVRYTDKVIADLIETLRADSHIDSALLYMSDHGESLGEKGLYLHGTPYMIAPAEQTTVPFVFWESAHYAKTMGVDPAAMKDNVARGISHDNLFATILGLAGVKTAARDPKLDLTVRH